MSLFPDHNSREGVMRHRFKLPVILLLLVCFQVVGVMSVDATKVKRRNIAELVNLGDQIIVGKVVSVTDGIDGKNVPYTEVTVEIREAPKGTASGTYTFRQWGLIKPRDMGNGLTNLSVTMDGWPTYSQGEEVVLFLYKEAKLTGLRTTVGLFQGKFTIKDGYVSNVINNEGLFDRVNAKNLNLSEKERGMVESKKGKIPEEMFLSFLRRSVTEKWFFEELGGE
jgi:hypothetical protein